MYKRWEPFSVQQLVLFAWLHEGQIFDLQLVKIRSNIFKLMANLEILNDISR